MLKQQIHNRKLNKRQSKIYHKIPSQVVQFLTGIIAIGNIVGYPRFKACLHFQCNNVNYLYIQWNELHCVFALYSVWIWYLKYDPLRCYAVTSLSGLEKILRADWKPKEYFLSKMLKEAFFSAGTSLHSDNPYFTPSGLLVLTHVVIIFQILHFKLQVSSLGWSVSFSFHMYG